MTEPGCLQCARGWMHCHSTWVVHRGAKDAECVGDPMCTTPPEAHPQVVDCEALLPGCCA